MWIKTLNRGYLNTDHIVSIRSRPEDYSFGDNYNPNNFVITANTEGDFYILTKSVSKERADLLLRKIVRDLSDVPQEGTFQTPYDPPTE